MKRRRFSRAPLAIAGVAATALWFASLMAASLLLEKPGVVEWRNGQGELRVIYHPPSDENELKIWLASLIVPGIVLGIGVLASFVRFGVYIVSVGTIVVAVALISRLDRWEALHTARFPRGLDLLGPTSTSNLLDPGQWEASAKEAAEQLSWGAIGFCAAAILISLLLAWRRSRRPAPLAETMPVLDAIGVSLSPERERETGGAPPVSGGTPPQPPL